MYSERYKNYITNLNMRIKKKNFKQKFLTSIVTFDFYRRN